MCNEGWESARQLQNGIVEATGLPRDIADIIARML